MKTAEEGDRTRTSTSTKDKILDAAETLFADKGLDATSMRDITRLAGVNLAAINYHFGSKNGLISAVFTRHLEPLNAARIARLEEIEHNQTVPSLEAVLQAFIRPVVLSYLDKPSSNTAFMRLMSRCLNEPQTHLEHVKHHFDSLMHRFQQAFTVALPGHKPSEIFWGLHFTIGTMHHTLHVLSQLRYLPHCPDEPIKGERVAQHLVAFTAAGIRAQGATSNLFPDTTITRL